MNVFQWVIILSVTLLLSSPVHSGLIRVSPVKLILDSQFKHNIINVINEGDEPIQTEIKAFEWTQDEEGKDQYTETKDLIFFPKILKLEKGESRIVRAGIKTPAISSEKTYRLFIKEMTKPTKNLQGSQVQFAVQFGVPIFVKPVKEDIKGKIEKVAQGNGKLKIDVRNTGNVHFRIESILIKGSNSKGKESFSKEISGWYLLAGVMRSHETIISQEVCQDTEKFDVEVKTDQFMLNEELDVIKTLCLP